MLSLPCPSLSFQDKAYGRKPSARQFQLFTNVKLMHLEAEQRRISSVLSPAIMLYMQTKSRILMLRSTSITIPLVSVKNKMDFVILFKKPQLNS